jgi:hypothetical protein
LHGGAKQMQANVQFLFWTKPAQKYFGYKKIVKFDDMR